MKKEREDLTGRIMGYYEILGPAPTRIQPSGVIDWRWFGRCVCGTIKDVSENHLRNRPNISCGCQKRTTLIDLTGYENEYLRVESRAESRPKGNGKYTTLWNCICLACGRHFVEIGYKIKNKERKSCGCLSAQLRSKAKLNDLTGSKHGRLLVKSRAEDYVRPSGGKDTQWNCVCDCGTECIKKTEYLLKSKNPSCGCWKSERTHEMKFEDLSGLLFGNLYVWEYYGSVEDSKGNLTNRFLCECFLCGKYCIKKAGDLKNGNSISCGCLKQSKGERLTKGFLSKNKIKFYQNYSFEDLLSDKQHPLFFDFAIIDNNGSIVCLIEYQGEQHYTDTDFGRRQREITDQLKKDYCFAHNIPLEEIRFDEDIETRVKEIIATYVNPVPSSEQEKV